MNGRFQSILILLLTALAAAPLALLARPSAAKQASGAKQTSNAAMIARGKYLVEQVAMCAECHTPRDQQGAYDRTRWLQGGTLYIRPVNPDANWALQAPDIAGLPGWTDAQAIRFFMTGLDWAGRTARPPMHPYRLPYKDAAAIVAYLRTLRH